VLMITKVLNVHKNARKLRRANFKMEAVTHPMPHLWGCDAYVIILWTQIGLNESIHQRAAMTRAGGSSQKAVCILQSKTTARETIELYLAQALHLPL